MLWVTAINDSSCLWDTKRVKLQHTTWPWKNENEWMKWQQTTQQWVEAATMTKTSTNTGVVTSSPITETNDVEIQTWDMMPRPH